ncbi:hypothetical protein [Alicyclobacillus acidoterrestris]|uniref:Uncharacterized protein n=1 Tax=Alicyclobacillus acidoterrestris (strain ATCC 49025 / DSM 3922 / CIP 106132 / NCIMB 13137 / GD3B) TaxID=1356854 RepID=T0BM47_ALIAG|nr:hypothetical protein [Alicyclobacillus acidoterrestris]EPZ45058.1 hypothetical protein N007_09625 [Alicyclobacillus acidoterrestris ATCC 49025]UNO48347.1 hypothetical protein K1I37_17000 [Alicyclobacillus acidoterrestris]
MNSKTTCRIIGWMFLLLGVAGLTMGHLGSYLQFTQIESIISVSLGALAILAARRRRRVAALALLLLGVSCVVWDLTNIWSGQPLLGTMEPLDGVLHTLAAIWAIGTCTYDVLTWRRQISAM